MAKKKISLNLAGLTPSGLVDKMKLHRQMLQGNPTFGSISLVDLDQAITLLEKALIDQNNAYQTYLQLSVTSKTLTEQAGDSLKALALQVEMLAQGDEAKILSSGFDVRKDKPTVSTAMTAPENVTLKEGDGGGRLALSFKTIKNAKAYIVQISYDISNNDAWAQCAITTKSRITLMDLLAGKEIWVRVAAIGASGQSDWSDIARRFVP